MRATPLSALANRRAATGGATSVRSGVLLGLENLAALVHAGLQVEVVRTAQFARILVFGVGRLLERVGGTAHATPRWRGLSSRNGHIEVLAGLSGRRPVPDGPALAARAK